MDGGRTDGRTDGETDGRTDRRTDGREQTGPERETVRSEMIMLLGCVACANIPTTVCRTPDGCTIPREDLQQ